MVERKDRHSDRLEAASYADDVRCQLSLRRDPRVENSEPIDGWISERLLARLKHLGAAYELSLLKRLPSGGSEFYPDIQVQDLEDELAFLFNVISDDVLLEAIAPLREMIKVAMRSSGWSLLIKSP